mmetsp:Transcript_20234/g.54010  ORF Transcript_20234/g.54010 Transcript_20234/m.54010 type:complete len:99 (+) Transcript_20234:221-517(+)
MALATDSRRLIFRPAFDKRRHHWRKSVYLSHCEWAEGGLPWMNSLWEFDGRCGTALEWRRLPRDHPSQVLAVPKTFSISVSVLPDQALDVSDGWSLLL